MCCRWCISRGAENLKLPAFMAPPDTPFFAPGAQRIHNQSTRMHSESSKPASLILGVFWLNYQYTYNTLFDALDVCTTHCLVLAPSHRAQVL